MLAMAASTVVGMGVAALATFFIMKNKQ